MGKKFLIAAIISVAIILIAFVIFKEEAVAPAPEANITVSSPVSNEKVSNPIIVRGQARVFENTFSYALKDGTGNKLYENNAMTDATDAGIFGNYTVKIPVPVSAPKDLVVEVFEYSAKDGSVTNLVRIPVELASQERTTVKIHLTNSRLDPEITCVKTFPVERPIYKTQEVAFMALSELFNGPTQQETKDGYRTSINKGVKINSIKIRNETAYVDFNETLETGVGGSCRVTAIRQQITNTLKEFSTIKNVVISVNGRAEDILQP